MDLEYSFGERVIVIPRVFPISFKRQRTLHSHYAIIGVGTVIDGYPMYADAMNECGLCMAGLNFPRYAYFPSDADCERKRIAPFELINYILATCSTVTDVKTLLTDAAIVDIPFSDDVPNATLHWHIADKHSSITVESTRNGLFVYDNPINVLTNSPSFDFQLEHFSSFSQLSCTHNGDRTSLGCGAVGLPGDLSSTSRLVRAAFLLGCASKKLPAEDACDCLLSLLAAVAMTDGSVVDAEGRVHKTTYSSCMLPSQGKYILKRAGSLRPSEFVLSALNVDSARLISL